MASCTSSTSLTGLPPTRVTASPACKPGVRRRAAGIDLHERQARTSSRGRFELRWAEADAQHAVLDFAACFERVDDSPKRGVHWDRVAGRLLVAGDRGGGRREADQLAAEIDQCAAAGAPAEFGVGLDERAEVVERRAVVVGWAGRVVEIGAGGRFAGEVGDDAPTGGGLAVAFDREGVADRDDELALAECFGVAEGGWRGSSLDVWGVGLSPAR